MTKHQIEFITSVERRRRWSREDKARLVAATFEPEASISDVARSAGIHVSQLFRWRKELCQISAPFVPQLVPNVWLLDRCITYAKAHRHPERMI